MAGGGRAYRAGRRSAGFAGSSPPLRSSGGGYNLLRIFLGLLLLSAAGLKGHQLATEPLLGGSILESRWVLVGLVEGEVFFGLWLLSGVLPGVSWAAAVLCFACFAALSVLKGLAGHGSCGCFGRVQVNPWFTAVLDVAVVASLLRFRPHQAWRPVAFGQMAELRRIALVCSMWFAVTVPGALAMSNPSVASLSEAGVVGGQGRLVVLEPDKWTGKRLPLLSYIDSPEPLDAGQWLVLLYHHDCPRCQQVVPRFPDLARVLPNGDKYRIALVEMPPYADGHADMLPVGSLCCRARLRDHYDWFAETPVAIDLRDATVVDVYTRGRVVLTAVRQGVSVP